jgi:hypothetical protein
MTAHHALWGDDSCEPGRQGAPDKSRRRARIIAMSGDRRNSPAYRGGGAPGGPLVREWMESDDVVAHVETDNRAAWPDVH